MSLGARIHPSFPLQLQPSLIFFYLTSSSCLHQTYRLFFKASPKLLSFTPVSTLIALFSVKLTSNWSPCFCPSYSDLKQPFETNNQLSPCLQTDVHAQHEPAGRRLTRGYSRRDAVMPCHPSSAAFIAATQTEPLSPNPHSLRVSGRRSGFLPPPTTRLVPQLSSPGKTLHLQRASSHTFHLFNFTVSVETAALGPQAEGPLPSLGPQHSSRCPRRPERRLRGCRGSVQPGPAPPSPRALPRASRCPDPAEGAQAQEEHSRLQLGGCFRQTKRLARHYFSNYGLFVSQSWEPQCSSHKSLPLPLKFLVGRYILWD